MVKRIKTMFVVLGIVLSSVSMAEIIFYDGGEFPPQDCPDCPLMLNIPGGTFDMGDMTGLGAGDELPVHSVTVPPFSIGVYEVTFSEWDACVAASGCSHNPSDNGFGRGSQPVINVSWNDIKEYLAWISSLTGKKYRLPSESEWEYATRAGTRTRYWFGDSIGTNQANCSNTTELVCGDSFDGTAPIGRFAANAFGIYDVHGNVWESVGDCFNNDYVAAPSDGSTWSTGDCTQHVIRGGSWFEHPNELRSSDRNGIPSSSRNTAVGFRVVKFEGFNDCPNCPVMLNIPGGIFEMGDMTGLGAGDELPVHSVTVPPFSIGVYEVTFSEWDACVAASGCSHNPSDNGFGRGSRPVINVSSNDIQEYLTWISSVTGKNYRLPSESEWEYATRAGTRTRYWFGNSIGTNQANCSNTTELVCGDSFDGTAPIGRFAANAFGIYDVHGNVWESVGDCFNNDYVAAPSDGSTWTAGDCNQNVIRGGSWFEHPNELRASDRNGIPRSSRNSAVGFRLVQVSN